MTTNTLLGVFRQLLLVLVVLLGFGGLFFIYYNPNTIPVPWSKGAVPQPTVYTHKLISGLKENFTTKLATRTLKELPPITKLDVMNKKKDSQDNDVIILVWKWPFGYKFKGQSCGSQFGIEGCNITDDRSLYDKAQCVMFHHREIAGVLPDLLNLSRPPHQKWVWMNMESPDNSPRISGIDYLFNLTCNYRRDSDIWVPYGRLEKKSDTDKTFTIPRKDKLVCWIVSNWNPNYRRVHYFNELSKHIKVEAYGRHFNRYVSAEDYLATMSSCKFYLSFESSAHKDYVTEKLFNPLIHGTVPVVLGPPRENYEQFIPSDSFIHVDDFKSPEDLAKHLTFLDQNQEAYEHYFTWRQNFTARRYRTYFGLEHACYICDYIKQHKGYKAPQNLNTWYWG